jgi:phosphoribosylanthranilate isomerase
MSRVKICGVTRGTDRDATVAAGADAVGVISGVPVDSPREVDPRRAATLLDGLAPFVTGVLVTMPDSAADAAALQRTVGADAVQVHTTLSPDAVGRLRERIDVPVIAAVDSADDPAAYEGVADALLLDSTDEAGGGGTGETHDWELARDRVRRLDSPVILAGGLAPDNVDAAVEAVGPYAVDTASGVEREGGIKDHDELRAFLRAAGRAVE